MKEVVKRKRDDASVSVPNLMAKCQSTDLATSYKKVARETAMQSGCPLVVLLGKFLSDKNISSIVIEYAPLEWEPFEMEGDAYRMTNAVSKYTSVATVQKWKQKGYKLHLGGRCGWTVLEAAIENRNLPLVEWLSWQRVESWKGISERLWTGNAMEMVKEKVSSHQEYESRFAPLPFLCQVRSRDLFKLASKRFHGQQLQTCLFYLTVSK